MKDKQNILAKTLIMFLNPMQALPLLTLCKALIEMYLPCPGDLEYGMTCLTFWYLRRQKIVWYSWAKVPGNTKLPVLVFFR